MCTWSLNTSVCISLEWKDTHLCNHSATIKMRKVLVRVIQDYHPIREPFKCNRLFQYALIGSGPYQVTYFIQLCILIVSFKWIIPCVFPYLSWSWCSWRVQASSFVGCSLVWVSFMFLQPQKWCCPFIIS